MSIFEKQKQALVINIILITTSIVSIYFSNMFNILFTDFLYILSSIMLFNYFVFIFYYQKISKGKL